VVAPVLSMGGIKNVVGVISQLRPVFLALGPFFESRLVIIYYHGIWSTDSSNRRSRMFGGIPIRRLAADLRLLSRDFSFASLDTLLDSGGQCNLDGKRLLSVTFDDGLELASSGTMDLLRGLGIPATTFVVTDCIDNRQIMWMHKIRCIGSMRTRELLERAVFHLQERIGLPPLRAGNVGAALRTWPPRRKDELADELWNACDMPPLGEILDEFKPYATWDHLQAWMKSGHQVGLHTASHPYCSGLDDEAIVSEIIAPAKLLQARLGLHQVQFSYPFGVRLPRGLEDCVRDCGLLSCMLASGRLMPRGTSNFQLQRIGVEQGVRRSVYAEPLIQAAKRRSHLIA
jgi:peptidoglycan/xylan/chitin deacetylase (PgdA/CDA1 family)